MTKSPCLFCSLLLLVGCLPVKTSNPEEAYEYWAGTKPSKEIQLIEGHYYQSPHFTLEYELFLKFKTTDEWWTRFIKTNRLELDEQNADWKSLTELPNWFKPNNSFLTYSRNDQFERSRYFFDSTEKICYIYETLGM